MILTSVVSVNYTIYIVLIIVWALHLYAARTYTKISYIAERRKRHETGTITIKPVSVIIVAHNQAAELEKNLIFILEQDYDDFEVIVVDDASTDNTADVLDNLEKLYPNLRHTFAPANARHISRKRLALTIGIKAARNEWLLFTEADSRPKTSHWIKEMSKHFGSKTKIILGYANYEQEKTSLSSRSIFFNLYHQMQYLTRCANHHAAYRCNPANFAYRKSLFMHHKGFADDFNLVSGAAEILVNRHSTPDNTDVSIDPQSAVICKSLMSASTWKVKRIFYSETRRHFHNTFAYRFIFNFKQSIVHAFYLMVIISILLSIIEQEWIVSVLILICFVVFSIYKIKWFNRSAVALGERQFYLSFLWYEFRLLWWHFRSLERFKDSPRSIFYRKPF